MKIALAQTRPFSKDIERNILRHIQFIQKAQANLIVFPELSLTGYELEFAAQLSPEYLPKIDAVLQKAADSFHCTIACGAPYFEQGEKYIAQHIYSPKSSKIVYKKTHLYGQEMNYFSSGNGAITIAGPMVWTPAICYDLAHESHVHQAKHLGTELYLCSVLNSFQGIQNDLDILKKHAEKYHLKIGMANFVSTSGSYQCAGQTSFWNEKGELLGQLKAENEGLLLWDADEASLQQENMVQ